MTEPDYEDIKEQKINRVTELFEQVLIDTALSVLYQLHPRDHRKHICYKSDCRLRDNIPF
jgi:hypothetical protein